MIVLGYIASLLMGVTLGMLGGGGSILTVPILVYLFSLDPVTATAYSLFIVGLTALVGGLSYMRSGEVDFKVGLIFAIPSFIGVYLVRAFVLPALPETLFYAFGFEVTKSFFIMTLFALMMLAASFSMIRKKKAARTDVLNTSAATRNLLVVFEGLLVGGVTGLVGAGGGFLIIPALVVLVGLPMRLAVGTSLFIISAKSLIGFIGDLQFGPSIDWTLLLSISALGGIGIVGGKILASKVAEKSLKAGFGYFVLIMGGVILMDQLF